MCHGRIGELPYDLISLQTQYVYKSFKLNEEDLYDPLVGCITEILESATRILVLT